MKPTNTQPELILQTALMDQGYRFETHCRGIPGTPDIVFRAEKIAVFVHGCYWHAHTCQYTKEFRAKRQGWESRQQVTKEKDLSVLEILREDGWRPVISWECRLQENLDAEVRRIAAFLDQERRSLSTSETS
jgi:DNA mismatch endonuclease, patch repair protein